MSKRQESADAGRPRTAEPPPDATAPAASAPSVVGAVAELMAERRRFEEWLAALDARREATPTRVFTRVHGDYTARLEAVVRQLTTHTEGLRAELAHLTTRLAELTEEQQQARDERAEAELRAHVGELTAAEWEATARAADERISELASRHADVETDLGRIRELLADAERPATPHLSTAAVPAAEPSAEVEASVTASVNAATAAATPASNTIVADSAEAALHVPSAAAPEVPGVGGATGDIPAEVTASVIAAESTLMDERGAEPGHGRASSFDEMAFLSSVVDAPADVPQAKSAAPAAAPVRPVPPPPAVPPTPPAPQARRDSMALRSSDEPIENLDATADRSILGKVGKKGTPLAANITGNHPIVLKEKAVESGRTLKCADCGAMNFPTEWYCERCGAELASL